jgi:hypothetical protein
MSSNRTIYDSEAYNLQINRSIGPGDYRLCESYAENNNQCFSDFGPIGSKSDVSLVKKDEDLYFNDMADVESQLSWRNHKLSKSNELPSFNTVKVNNKKDCNNKLTSEDTRFTHPIDDYRCMSLLAYQYEPHLHVNPQCHVQESYDRIGLNSRLYSKDMYILKEQIPWDKGDAFPKEQKTKKTTCLYTKVNCNEPLPNYIPSDQLKPMHLCYDNIYQSPNNNLLPIQTCNK